MEMNLKDVQKISEECSDIERPLDSFEYLSSTVLSQAFYLILNCVPTFATDIENNIHTENLDYVTGIDFLVLTVFMKDKLFRYLSYLVVRF